MMAVRASNDLALVTRSQVSTENAVAVLDKAGWPGGSLETRRVESVDRQRHAGSTRLDHGAIDVTFAFGSVEAAHDVDRYAARRVAV